MDALLIAAFALLGASVGSFLNVCIDRLALKKSIVYPPSHCDNCRAKLSVAELIPIVSYLWLRGRCRHCGEAIPRRILWVELGSAAVFGFINWCYGLSVELAVVAFYYCLFLVIFVIDLEHQLILNSIVYPAVVAALVISAFLPQLDIAPGIVINTYMSGVEFVPGIASAAVGGAIGLVLFLAILFVSRGGMGWGDVKMAALMGLVLGYPLIFVAIFLAVIVGGLIALLLLVLKVKGRKQGIPFGPFLSLGAIITLLWGADILNWYLGLF